MEKGNKDNGMEHSPENITEKETMFLSGFDSNEQPAESEGEACSITAEPAESERADPATPKVPVRASSMNEKEYTMIRFRRSDCIRLQTARQCYEMQHGKTASMSEFILSVIDAWFESDSPDIKELADRMARKMARKMAVHSK